MMSQPEFGLDQRLLDQHRDRLVVENDAVLHQPVMAVAGIGIERDIAEHADLRHFFFDGADGAADEVVRVQRFGTVVVAAARLGIGKQRQAGNIELRRAFGRAHRFVDRKPVDAGHRVHRRAHLGAVDQEQRPDQVVGGEHVFAHHAARPLGAAIAPRPDRQVELVGRCGGSHRRQAGRALQACPFNGAAEFDGHFAAPALPDQNPSKLTFTPSTACAPLWLTCRLWTGKIAGDGRCR